MEIKDFGEKIGGAKKELWKDRGLSMQDLVYMNDAEKNKLVNKDNIWKKPNYKEMVENGVPVRVAYFIKTIRDATITRPVFFSFDSIEKIEEKRENYITFVSELRDAVMKMSKEEEILNFFDNVMSKYFEFNSNGMIIGTNPPAKGVLDTKLFDATRVKSFYYLDRNIAKKQFCYSKEEKILSDYLIFIYDENVKIENDELTISNNYSKMYYRLLENLKDVSKWHKDTYFIIDKKRHRLIKNNFDSIDEAKKYILDTFDNTINKEKIQRKKKFIPEQLVHLTRIGDDYRNNRDITGDDMIETFDFKGGEFGNWLNENDRQYSLNYGYDALLDLSKALNISPKDISLGNRLSIAFGSRGSGSAFAHYEPDRQVINLTKLKGAGSLAHEWAHALDDIFCKSLGKYGFTTENAYRLTDYPVLKELINTMKYTIDGKDTNFYKNSKIFDESFSKEKYGYWQSTTEMFARCFACYIKDKLNGRNDYLCGHSDTAINIAQDKDGNNILIKAFPEGEERELINEKIDSFIEFLKEKEFLHDYNYKEQTIDDNSLSF